MKVKLLFICICASLLLFAGAGTVIAQPLKMGDELPLDTAVRIGKLDNGMRYFLRHNGQSAGMADFYIVYNVGSIQEDDTQSGLAHFLEHMAFNGTRHFPGNSMIGWLESIGLQFGTNLNAATGMEMTYYQLTQVPLKRESVTDSLLLILHDWSGSLLLEKKEIDKERGVIIEELRQRNTPQFRIGNKAASYVYGDTRYAHRDMLGTEEFLKNFKPQLLRDYYKCWYRPDLQAIIIVGDFDVDKMEAKLKKVMADIPAAENPQPKEKIRIPDNANPVVAILSDPEERVSKANFFIKRPAVPHELNNRVGANYMNMLINVAVSMMNVRFGDLAQQSGCPFTTATLLNSSLTETCDALELQVIARGDAIAEAFSSAYGELERVRRYGFTQEELDFVRMGILRGGKHAYESGNEKPNGAFAQEYMNHYTKNTPVLSVKEQWAFLQLMMRQATIEQVNELVKTLIAPANNVLVLTVPEKVKATLPKEEQLANFFSWVRGAEIEPYKPETVDKPLLAELPVSGKVTATEKGVYGSTVWKLSNGLRVVVMPTPYSRNQIIMNGQAGGGLSTIDTSDYLTASMVAQIAGVSGAGEFNGEQLRKLLSTKSVSVQPSIGRFSSDISGSAAKADVETMLQLAYLYFMHPNFDRERFDMLVEANRMNLVNSADAPEFVMNKLMNKATYGDNLRTQIPTEQSLKGIDFAKMAAIYRHFFTDAAGNYTFYFLGDIEPDVLKPLVERYLGSLPVGTQRLAWKDDGVRMLPGKKEERMNIPMQTPKGMVSLVYTGEVEYTQQNTLLMAMLASCLQSRYMETIREEKGGAYGVNVSGTLSRQPVPTYSLNIAFQTAPDKVDELLKVVREELERMAKSGPARADLDKTLEYWRKAQSEGLKNNQVWLSYLQNYYTWGEDWNTDYEKLLNTVSSESVKELAGKILKDGNLKQVVLLPLK